MLKWIFTLVIAIFLLGLAGPHLARWIRFGRLPGDVVLRLRGRTYRFPFVSTLLLSAALLVLARCV